MRNWIRGEEVNKSRYICKSLSGQGRVSPQVVKPADSIDGIMKPNTYHLEDQSLEQLSIHRILLYGWKT